MKEFKHLASVMCHDEETLAHSLNVTFLLRAVLDYLPRGYISLDDERDLLIAAPLHDIGKCMWSERWRTASKDELTKTDFALMNTHPLTGAYILEHEVGLNRYSITELVASHHEKPGGSGTPFGKTPTRAALVLAACDVYCACREPRAYRLTRLTHEEALNAVKVFAPPEISRAVQMAVDFWRVSRHLRPALHAISGGRATPS